VATARLQLVNCNFVYVDVSGGFLTDAGSLYDAEKVLLLCLSACKRGHSIQQLMQGLECCVRSVLAHLLQFCCRRVSSLICCGFVAARNQVYLQHLLAHTPHRHTYRLICCSSVAKQLTVKSICSISALCSLWGYKNRPTTFPGQMSYKATKPGLVYLSYLSMFLLCCCLLGPICMYC